ncbi:hypothetical protein EJF18_30258 [Clavispora lusitaniae]|uniref:Uncharacterized protein n=2 Tax=Clavispora lusitaniae TaxID=36911 RepID=C4Y3B4_CLAL4|nr:uncharacterized protein CLUG_03027 [Clavispora lusitaniae ATCC 42720]QFZ27289.1 hypothetical protein EJF14_30258 [Clavispora lusitaniae]EEQ38902.1 predicted protein [Clavispora lusitaniae ATCC 42720]QFZ33403.1 hypothetical protein EJF16_30258 [Clavispora lusitaniae]QFZ39074.1 hypothetical protein EJF15_30258 [Clavispora lusitaniae]QFZ44756.1 hypothetical protein EJF18_30258 [Clavispora lusitaniae]
MAQISAPDPTIQGAGRLAPEGAPDLLRLSPVRRSGSPLRRKQISELESAKRPRSVSPRASRTDLEGSTSSRRSLSPHKMARFENSPPESADSTLHTLVESVDRVASTFASTATSLRDMKLSQQELADEMAQMRRSIQSLQKDVAWLIEQAKDKK